MGAVKITQPVQTQRVRCPNLAVFISRANGVPFEEGLRKADEANLVIASNARLSRALVGSNEWQQIRAAFACWAGTYTSYVEPNTTFEKAAEIITDLESIVGSRHFLVDIEAGRRRLFPVPEEYLGIANAILVAEHPDYRLHADGKDSILVPDGMALKQAVDIVERFPASDGWYLPDPKHDIPRGEEASYSLEARYLWRISKRVGPVRRGYYDFYGDARQFVNLLDLPSYGLGMAVEASEAGAPLETGAPVQLKLTRKDDGRLIVEGTKEQLDDAVRLLGNLGKQ